MAIFKNLIKKISLSKHQLIFWGLALLMLVITAIIIVSNFSFLISILGKTFGAVETSNQENNFNIEAFQKLNLLK